ncbi:MAG: ABC transporter permease, partial [Deltaproteobacteria bacterium]
MQRIVFFLRFLNWFTARQLRVHPWRVLAVVLGIALGAAVFTSVRLAVYASLDSFTRSMDFLSGKAEWTVMRPDGRVPEGLVARLRSHPAVETASPLISSYVSISKKDTQPFLLIGLDPLLDYPLRQWRIESTSGHADQIWLDLLRLPHTIIMSQPLARQYAITGGDLVSLEHVHQIAQFRVLGMLEPEGLSLVEGGYVGLTDIATMQEFTGLQGWVDRIDLRLKPDATEQAVAQLKSLLPPGIDLQAPTETKESGLTMIHAYQLNLSMLSFVSLFVGMFLVYSLVSLNAASRRRGTISNLFVRVRVEKLHLDFWEILLSFGVTLFVSLVAAYRPAREATHIAPREAMMMHESPARKKHPGRHPTFLGMALILLAWPVAKLPSLPGLPLSGYSAVLILVVGFSILSLPLLQWMGSRLPPLLRRIAGEPAFLAGRYVRDAGNRTAISVGALVTAMALFVALVIMVHSFRDTVSLWVNQTLAGDFFVRPKMSGANRYHDPLPQKVVDGLKKIQGVDVMAYRHLELRYGKIPYELEAVSFEPLLRYGKFLLLHADMAKIKGSLIAGDGVLVSEVFANETGLSVGERYRVRLGNVLLDLPVLGVFRDYRTRGGVVYANLRTYQKLTGDQRWSGVRFFFKNHNQNLESSKAHLRSEVLRYCGKDHPLEMVSGLELRQEILKIFDETFAVTTVLLLIALLVAGLGITTTLTVLVLERIQQLNTLSAVGAGTGQIRAMIFWEAVLMVVAGEGIGLVCGFLMSHLLIYVINLQSFGWTFLYRVNWNALVVSLPLILATALLAA